MKVSIVVPVYNTGKYLKKCIDSLLNQNFDNYEIIIINDNSPDDSEGIILSYNNPKIIYIKNSENKGIGYNRNLGIEKSKGKYICFIDSDDYVSNNFLSELYLACESEKLDMAICDYNYVDNNKIKQVKLIDFNTTNLDESPDLITKIPLGPCNKMYRKDLIISNNIRFEEKLKYEDIPFVGSSLYYSNKIGKVNKFLNYFTVHENSETSTRDLKVFDIFKELDNLRKIYKNKSKYLDEYIVSTVFNYTIQQRYQKDKKIAYRFIEMAFKYLKDNDIDYKNSNYIKSRGLKGILEKNKLLTKIYCFIYRK